MGITSSFAFMEVAVWEWEDAVCTMVRQNPLVVVFDLALDFASSNVNPIYVSTLFLKLLHTMTMVSSLPTLLM